MGGVPLFFWEELLRNLCLFFLWVATMTIRMIFGQKHSTLLTEFNIQQHLGKIPFCERSRCFNMGVSQKLRDPLAFDTSFLRGLFAAWHPLTASITEHPSVDESPAALSNLSNST